MVINFKDIIERLPGTIKQVKSIKGPIIYRIYRISTGMSYIGSTKSLYDRLYCKLFGYYWKVIGENTNDMSRIHRAITSNGFSDFNIEILEYHNDIELARDRESILIEKYDSYYSGYNATPTGHWKNRPKEPERSGLYIWISRDDDSRMIPRSLYSEFELRGYKRGHTGASRSLKGTVYMHNDYETIRVHENEVSAAIDLGYEKGRGFDDPKLGRIVMTDGKTTWFIKPEQYEDCIDRGLYRGKDEVTKFKMRNKVCMTNGIEDKRVTPDKVSEMESRGYWKGRKPSERSNLRYIININTGEIKRVHLTKLDEFLSTGNWIRGKKKLNKQFND